MGFLASLLTLSLLRYLWFLLITKKTLYFVIKHKYKWESFHLKNFQYNKKWFRVFS